MPPRANWSPLTGYLLARPGTPHVANTYKSIHLESLAISNVFTCTRRRIGGPAAEANGVRARAASGRRPAGIPRHVELTPDAPQPAVEAFDERYFKEYKLEDRAIISPSPWILRDRAGFRFTR